MEDYAIQTEQITKSYGSFMALDHMNLHVKKGSIYGLIGDNGAGKSTLLKLLTGLSYPSAGEIRIFGKHEEKELRHIRKHIGCMIEQPGLFANMTVEQTLYYYCIQKGIPEKKKVSELLHLINMEAQYRSKCKTLSLGQKQRLGLAIALLGEPQILILDEPINGLDPSGIIEIRNLLRRLNEEKNITILLSSHILSELQQVATTYGFLNKGKLLEEISEQELLEKCSNCIEIKVTDIQQYAMLFEQKFSKDTFKIFPDDKIRIYNPSMSAEAYSKLASNHDIYITEMNTVQTSLENYYLELKKGDVVK